jgi:predicted nucleic acid-binding protein
LVVSKVFWDTNLFIYLFEDYGEASERVALLRKRMLERNDHLYTSTLTLGEVLVKPVEASDEALKRTYQHTISTTAVVVPFSLDAALIYADLRRDRTIRAPDAIQLACAACAGVDLFLTNDERLSHKVIPGVQFVQSLARAFL